MVALIAAAGEVSRMCRAPTAPTTTAAPATFADAAGHEAGGKLRRVLDELLATEAAYVAGLGHLLDRYVRPLWDEAFLSRCL